MTFYLGIDPGHISGICIVQIGTDRLLSIIEPAQIEYSSASKKFKELAARYSPQIVAIEQYTMLPWQSRQNSSKATNKGLTMRVIGMAESVFDNAEIVFQRSNILETTPMISEVYMPKNHAISHWISAYNHIFYCLRKRNLITTPAEYRNAHDE